MLTNNVNDECFSIKYYLTECEVHGDGPMYTYKLPVRVLLLTSIGTEKKQVSHGMYFFRMKDGNKVKGESCQKILALALISFVYR